LLPALLPAWNDAGHRTIASLAWLHLTPIAKARALEILRHHPDFATVPDFVTASTWPDLIRSDPRFGASAPPLNGFPDMDRHTAWHFINTPIPSRFAALPVDSDNAVTALRKLLPHLRPTGTVTAAEAYALPWILHIVSDLHQPLHTVTRFAFIEGKPVHDRGGNTCYVSTGRNLHSLWDGLANNLEDRYPMPRRIDTDPETWVREGVAAALSHVYNFTGPCAESSPAKLSKAYLRKAKEVARQRAALAAYRLATILNRKLGR
jgi:hypothetical protein